MKQALRVYAAVLRLVRLLPPQTRAYYARFARENFATYRDEEDAIAISNLFDRSYTHTCWILTKYGVDTVKADTLKQKQRYDAQEIFLPNYMLLSLVWLLQMMGLRTFDSYYLQKSATRIPTHFRDSAYINDIAMSLELLQWPPLGSEHVAPYYMYKL